MEDRFRILFDHSSDAHLILDETGVTDCNDATVKLLRCKSKSEVLAIHPSRLSPEFQPDGMRSVDKSRQMDALARRNGVHRFEWMHQKADGEVFPVAVTLNAVDIDGKPSLLAVWHDLTEFKKTQKELQALNNRMRLELENASVFQRSLLPSTLPQSEKFEAAWFYKPCEELGGDNLNVFPIGNNSVGFYVLDVTGHGVASALLSVTATHFLSGFFKSHCPKEVATLLNRHFSKEGYKNHTLTIVYGILDLKKLTFHYTSAGHTGPVRVSKKGVVKQFDSLGAPIGMFAESKYGQKTIQLKKGDQIFLFSDGVNEIRNKNDEEWGLEGVHNHLKKEAKNEYSLEYTVNSLARSVYQWSSPNKPTDDISILGFKIREN